MDSSGSNSKTPHQNRCTCKVKFALSVLCLKLYNRPGTVEPSQPAYQVVRVSAGAEARAHTLGPTFLSQPNQSLALTSRAVNSHAPPYALSPLLTLPPLTLRLQSRTHHFHW